MSVHVPTHAERERAYIESLPGVHFVQAAGRAYPDDGIAKGQSYYHWSTPHHGVERSKTLPLLSQLTTGIGQTIVEAFKCLEDAVASPEGRAEALTEAACCADIAATEYADRASELEELVEMLHAASSQVEAGGGPVDLERLLRHEAW